MFLSARGGRVVVWIVLSGRGGETSLYHARYADAAVPLLMRAINALGPREVWYAAPETGRQGGDLLLGALEALGYARESKKAPDAFVANPLVGSGDDAAHLA